MSMQQHLINFSDFAKEESEKDYFHQEALWWARQASEAYQEYQDCIAKMKSKLHQASLADS